MNSASEATAHFLSFAKVLLASFEDALNLAVDYTSFLQVLEEMKGAMFRFFAQVAFYDSCITTVGHDGYTAFASTDPFSTNPDYALHRQMMTDMIRFGFDINETGHGMHCIMEGFAVYSWNRNSTSSEDLYDPQQMSDSDMMYMLIREAWLNYISQAFVQYASDQSLI